jgi:hypothetical protein
VRYLLPTSLTLVGFTVITGLAGCGSDAATPGGSSGASGKGPVSSAGSGPVTGASGAAVTGASGSGSGNAAAGSPVVGSAGSNPGTAGSPSTSGGSPGTAGTGTTSAGTSAGGAPGVSGGGNAAGAPSGADANGKTNAKPGDMASTKFDYLKLGEIRILNNNWGSVESKCTTPMSVFVNANKSFGWSFDRGGCNGTGEKPDFPQLEFGIHPFGLGSSAATSPNFSSTTLLPLQIKDITSASVTLTDLAIKFDKEGKWDLTFEFWLSSKDPGKTQSDAGVYSELMTFWGWEANRWPENATPPGPVVRNCSPCKATAGQQVTAGKTYKLEVQDDQWAGNKWRYFQFRDTAGPAKSFPGKLTVDVKKLIDYLVNTMGYSKDLWVARLEVGSEIDDNTKGTVTMTDVEFEVNGQKRSPVFGQ